MNITRQKDFEFDVVLQKPLMAHLSTVRIDEQDSPVGSPGKMIVYGFLELVKIASLKD